MGLQRVAFRIDPRNGGSINIDLENFKDKRCKDLVEKMKANLSVKLNVLEELDKSEAFNVVTQSDTSIDSSY